MPKVNPFHQFSEISTRNNLELAQVCINIQPMFIDRKKRELRVLYSDLCLEAIDRPYRLARSMRINPGLAKTGKVGNNRTERGIEPIRRWEPN